MKAFLKNINLRPSCYECKAKGFSSQSDLTLADLWGIRTVFPQMDDDKGTSLVFINTERGRQSMDYTKMEVRGTTYERVKPLNPACYRSVASNPKRDIFFARLGNESLIELINDCTKPTIKQRIRYAIVLCKSLINRMLGRIGGTW